MKILVAGSRTFDDFSLLEKTLNRFTKKVNKKDLIVMHGGAKGADSLASRWCDKNFVTYKIYRPDYSKYPPKRAPLMRNQEMVNEENIDLVIAFWDGVSRGTQDLIDRAEAKGLKVIVINFGEEDE